MSSGGRDLVYGEAATSGGTMLGYLGVCERPSGGGTESFGALTGCTASTSSADWVEIYGGSGSDRIAPLTSNIGTYITCGSYRIYPFAWSHFSSVAGGGGGDFIYGTANGDLLVSNIFGSGTGDSSLDAICGLGGDDYLYGDGDDNASANQHECLDGGAGTDYCASVLGGADGIGGDGTNSTCETQVGSWYSTTASCGCATPAFW